MTCPNLIELLLMKFNSDEEIMFLDMGADNIEEDGLEGMEAEITPIDKSKLH